MVDLTAELSDQTPLLELPPEFGQTARFELEEISRYDERGPAWYWNNFHTGEHRVVVAGDAAGDGQQHRDRPDEPGHVGALREMGG